MENRSEQQRSLVALLASNSEHNAGCPLKYELNVYGAKLRTVTSGSLIPFIMSDMDDF